MLHMYKKKKKSETSASKNSALKVHFVVCLHCTGSHFGQHFSVFSVTNTIVEILYS